jgi:hypothetical protein
MDRCADRVVGNFVRCEADWSESILFRKKFRSECARRVSLGELGAEFVRYAMFICSYLDALLASIDFAAVDWS